MKNVNQILFSGLFLSIILCSCGKSGGDKFIGTWQNQKGARIVITSAGETAYTVKSIGPRDGYGVAFSNTTTTTYQDGNLVSAGVVVCSYSNNKIIIDGQEFDKTDNVEQTANEQQGKPAPTAKELEEKRICDSVHVADSMALVMAEMQKVADEKAKKK